MTTAQAILIAIHQDPKVLAAGKKKAEVAATVAECHAEGLLRWAQSAREFAAMKRAAAGQKT